ncbi:MAG: DUF3332 family protein [Proteobacteria bacterium]|nr:DUF3332 family protein [Pseudomonadota bacterium]
MKHWFKVAICSLALAGLLNGCFGSFGATKLLWSFNRNVHSNVFVQTIVMWCFTILPAYAAVIFADWAVINIIEFFQGSNPIGSNLEYTPNEDGSVTAVDENGNTLKFTAVGENRMIVERDGVVVGEVAVDENQNITMTNYATADVQQISPNAIPAM